MDESLTLRDWILFEFLQMGQPERILQSLKKLGSGQCTTDVQSYFVDHVVKNEIAVKYPTSSAFRIKILKMIISEVEMQNEGNSKGVEVADGLFEALCEAMANDTSRLEASSWCHRTFVYNDSSEIQSPSPPTASHSNPEPIKHNFITLRLSTNMLQGSTGCFVWPASFLLADFLLKNKRYFSGKRVLELGSGSGLIAVLLSRFPLTQATFTDGNEEALSNLRHNLDINRSAAAVNAAVLSVHWSKLNEKGLCGLLPDFIIGADLVYDPSVVKSLAETMAFFIGHKTALTKSEPTLNSCLTSGVPTAIICSVVRNESTREAFFKEVGKVGLSAVHSISIAGPAEYILCPSDVCNQAVVIDFIQRTGR